MHPRRPLLLVTAALVGCSGGRSDTSAGPPETSSTSSTSAAGSSSSSGSSATGATEPDAGTTFSADPTTGAPDTHDSTSSGATTSGDTTSSGTTSSGDTTSSGTTSSGTSSGETGETTGAAAELVPDFMLIDVNANSASYLQPVSPRDYLERVSGWYYTHAT